MKVWFVTIDVIGDMYGTNTQLVGIFDTYEKALKAKEENTYKYLPHCCDDPRELMETEAIIHEVELNKTYEADEDIYCHNVGNIILACYIE